MNPLSLWSLTNTETHLLFDDVSSLAGVIIRGCYQMSTAFFERVLGDAKTSTTPLKWWLNSPCALV